MYVLRKVFVTEPDKLEMSIRMTSSDRDLSVGSAGQDGNVSRDKITERDEKTHYTFLDLDQQLNIANKKYP